MSTEIKDRSHLVWPHLFTFSNYILFVCLCTHILESHRTCVVERGPPAGASSLHQVNPKDQTQVVGLVSKCLYPLNRSFFLRQHVPLSQELTNAAQTGTASPREFPVFPRSALPIHLSTGLPGNPIQILCSKHFMSEPSPQPLQVTILDVRR